MTARSSAEQVEEALGRIQALDGRLGAFVTVLAERARAEAAARDAERAAGRVRGPLHGVPVAVKDLIDLAGVVTAAGSPKLADNRAERDASLVDRLREAGAVVIGKTRTHEFAYGVLTPGTVNPWDEARIAGGSSGGSAAAVAAGLVRHAVGSDTAGSIRIPAACCGVVGLKPTYGAVPARGVFPLSWSCDTLGPIAGDVTAATRLFEVLSGQPAPERAAPAADRPLRLGRLVGDDLAMVDPAVRGELDRLCGLLEARGARIDEVELPLAAARAAVAAIVLPELAAAHERLLAGTGEQGYGPRVLAAIRLGQSALATEYLAGLRYRGSFVRRVEALLEERDALLLETIPVVAPRIGAHAVRLGDGRDAGIQEFLTALPGAFNCSGSPVVSLPIGLVGGLPVGASLVGRIGADHELLRVAAAVEDVAGFSGRPALHAIPPDPTDVAAYDEQLRRSWVGEPPVLRAPIEIREYDPEWPRSYEREAARVRSVLGDRVVRLEHAGSTSVPGLPAKPIIDMVLEVPDSGDEAAYVPDMEAAGYVLRIREPEWFQHRLFKGPDTDVNLHVFSAGCAETGRMLRFRDWLRSNAADRELYTRVKRELAARDWKYMQQYADAKTAVVLEIMGRAGGGEVVGPP